MKAALALAIMGLLISACASTPRHLKGDLLGISGVFVGDSPDVVVSRLGTPVHQERQSDFVSLIYRYEGFSVGFDGQDAVDLQSTNPGACTTEGLCPRDPLAKMNRLYGAPEVANRETGTFYEYYSSDSTCWYQIAGRDGVVSSIGVVCQP